MTLDSFLLAGLVAETEDHLLGQPFRSAVATGNHEVTLTFGRNKALLLSAAPESARLHLCPAPPAQESNPTPFSLCLRKHLRGKRVAAVRQMDFDRIVVMDFAGFADSGRQETLSLIAEIMGRRSNVLLVNQEGVIVDCIKKVPGRLNRYREILPGVRYARPPVSQRINPLSLSEEELRCQLAEPQPGLTVANWLSARFLGMSQSLTAELAARARVPHGVAQAELTPQEQEHLMASLSWLREVVTQHRLEPVSYRLAAGQPIEGFAPVRLASLSDTLQERVPSLSESLHEWFAHAQARQAVEQRRSRLVARLGQARARLSARLEEVERSLEASEPWPEWQREGELVLANLTSIPAGTSAARLTDFYDRNLSTVQVSLSPDLSAAENARLMLERAAKARRRGEKASVERERLRHLLAAVERIEVELNEGFTDEKVALAEEKLAALAGERTRRTKRGRSAHGSQQASFVRHVISEGWILLMGRSAQENDQLLRQHAASDDLWFHVRGLPGAHAILRTEGHPERVTPSTIEEAARLLTKRGKASKLGMVPVDYALVKHVRRKRGGPPGEVTYSHHKTVDVRPAKR